MALGELRVKRWCGETQEFEEAFLAIVLCIFCSNCVLWSQPGGQAPVSRALLARDAPIRLLPGLSVSETYLAHVAKSWRSV